MKKKLLIVCCVVVAAALSVPLFNLLVGKASRTALTTKQVSDPALAQVAKVFEVKCAHCHVPGTDAPFYAKLPVASTVIARDVANGLRMIVEDYVNRGVGQLLVRGFFFLLWLFMLITAIFVVLSS